MAQLQKRQLRLPRIEFDYSVLPSGKRGSENILRPALADYVQRQFAKLDGVVETLSVDQREINVTWSPGESDPNSTQGVVALLNKGQPVEGILLLKLLLSDAPDDPVLLYNLGLALSDKGQLDQAIRHLRRLLEVEPEQVNGRVALGVALARSGQTEAAVEELRGALAADPANPWAHRNLGACLMKLNQVEDGVAHFHQATELSPQDQLAWLGLAQALEAANDGKGAEAAYRQTLELDEHSTAAEMARRGLSDLAQKSFRAALPNVERPDAVWYCLGALERFEKISPAEVQKIGFEIALLGRKGLTVTDPRAKYQLQSLPGEYTGLHLVCLMYVAFKQFAPEQDVGFDLSKEYELARQMHAKEG